MEEDNFKPECDAVRKNIKSFMEDMLKEEEYKDFLDHLETCSECDNYVRSIDSFSNQLWRLGDVNVPSDFSSAVMFKLSQPEEQPEEDQESATGKKWLIGGVAFILVSITLTAGILSYFKLRKPPEKEVLIVKVPSVPEEDAAVAGDPESDIDFDQLDGIAAILDEPADQIAFGVVDLSGGDSDEEAADTGPKLIHWHYLQYDKSEELEAMRLRRKLRKIESDKRKRYREKDQSGTDPEAVAQLESAVAGLEEEKVQVEEKIAQKREAKKSREGEPANTLESMGLRIDYQDHDFVLFSGPGDGVEVVLNKIRESSGGESSLHDFTPLSSYPYNRDYRVSVYLVKKETSAHHWHVHLSMLSQKVQLMKTIQDNGGMITYEFAEEVTFSVLESKIENIKAQMPAMRISMSEYGDVTGAQDPAVDETVVISIYFSR